MPNIKLTWCWWHFDIVMLCNGCGNFQNILICHQFYDAQKKLTCPEKRKKHFCILQSCVPLIWSMFIKLCTSQVVDLVTWFFTHYPEAIIPPRIWYSHQLVSKFNQHAFETLLLHSPPETFALWGAPSRAPCASQKDEEDGKEGQETPPGGHQGGHHRQLGRPGRAFQGGHHCSMAPHLPLSLHFDPILTAAGLESRLPVIRILSLRF